LVAYVVELKLATARSNPSLTYDSDTGPSRVSVNTSLRQFIAWTWDNVPSAPVVADELVREDSAKSSRKIDSDKGPVGLATRIPVIREGMPADRRVLMTAF
jgi:hypothetical protein